MHRIDIRHIGKAHCHTELVQFVDSAQRLRVIASESVCTLDDDVRELARASVIQEALVFRAIGCCPCQYIDILIKDAHVGALQYVFLNGKALPRS